MTIEFVVAATCVDLVMAYVGSLDRTAVRDYLQIVTYIVTIGGVFVGLRKYFNEKTRERRNREKQAFETTNKRYADFLELCLEYDPLMFDLSHELLAVRPDLGSDEQKDAYLNRTILMAYALTMIETAYVWYQRERTAELEDQWRAWERYVDIWLQRPDFSDTWRRIERLFHDKFVRYVNERLDSLAARSSAAPSASHEGFAR
jgi:hypothetical protein